MTGQTSQCMMTDEEAKYLGIIIDSSADLSTRKAEAIKFVNGLIQASFELGKTFSEFDGSECQDCKSNARQREMSS